MQVEINRVDECKRKINISIPNNVVSKELSKIYQEINQRANIKGFRKGKVPRKVLEQLYKRDAEVSLLQELVPKACKEVFSENNLKTAGDYLLEKYELKDDGELKLDISVEVIPDISLKNYKGFKIQKKSADVTDEDIDNALKQMQHDIADLKTVESRGAENGDEMVLDFSGKIDGKLFNGGEGKDFRLILGEKKMVEGFEEKLLGAKIGEKRDVEIIYPQDIQNKELAGKKVLFEVLVKDVKERIFPQINDEFAKDLGDYNDLNALKEKIKDDIKNTKEYYNKLEYQKEVIEKILEENQFISPEILIKKEFEFLKKSFASRLSGGKAEDINFGKESEKIEQELLKEAEKRVKESLILEKIAEEEKIVVDENEVDEEIRKRAESTNQNFNVLKKAFQQNDAYEVIRSKIREEKVLNFLLNCAIVN